MERALIFTVILRGAVGHDIPPGRYSIFLYKFFINSNFSKGSVAPPSPDDLTLDSFEKYHILGNRFQTCVDERIDCREELRRCQVDYKRIIINSRLYFLKISIFYHND